MSLKNKKIFTTETRNLGSTEFQKGNNFIFSFFCVSVVSFDNIKLLGSVKNKMIENERNHRDHRGKLNSLCSQKKFPLKDITEKIIGCAIEVHSTLGPGLLINFNVERLKDGIKRLIL